MITVNPIKDWQPTFHFGPKHGTFPKLEILETQAAPTIYIYIIIFVKSQRIFMIKPVE